jgi:hypothetical protein
MHASASYDRNRGYASIVEEILEQAEQTDREEDERYGDARGDELPEPLRTREGRRAALQAARDSRPSAKRGRQPVSTLRAFSRSGYCSGRRDWEHAVQPQWTARA